MSQTLSVSPELVTHLKPFSPVSEAFRVLRTNLQFMGVDQPLKRILVTSATPVEGKTVVASNLAAVFAQSGARVCLMDADLRRPRIANFFGVNEAKGLSSVLASHCELEECLQESLVSGLAILASGPIPPNPAELLGSRRMVNLLHELIRHFDLVVIDSPPVLAVSDSVALAPWVDGVILVACEGVVARQQIVEARRSLENVKARVLGTVLNRAEAKRHEEYYYSRYSDQDWRDFRAGKASAVQQTSEGLSCYQ